MIFSQEHIDMILEGTKSQTRRKSNKYEIGKSYSIQPGRGKPGIVGARIKITKKRREKLGDISLSDVHKEGYDSIDDFIKVVRRINGEWNPKQEMYVFDFETVKS